MRKRRCIHAKGVGVDDGVHDDNEGETSIMMVYAFDDAGDDEYDYDHDDDYNN